MPIWFNKVHGCCLIRKKTKEEKTQCQKIISIQSNAFTQKTGRTTYPFYVWNTLYKHRSNSFAYPILVQLLFSFWKTRLRVCSCFLWYGQWSCVNNHQKIPKSSPHLPQSILSMLGCFWGNQQTCSSSKMHGVIPHSLTWRELDNR